jgi:plastocyanin
MNKSFTLSLIIGFLIMGNLLATTDTIKTVGFAFVPPVLDANVGDTVVFSLASMHNAVQVTDVTWATGDTASNGGFRFPVGGGNFKFEITTAGIIYYVCQPHVASFGMKGMIIVLGPVNIASSHVDNTNVLEVYPNPANEFIYASFYVPANSRIKIDLIDMTGRIVGNLLNANYSQGNYSNTFSLAKFSEGRYFIRYTYGNLSKVKPIIIYRLR